MPEPTVDELTARDEAVRLTIAACESLTSEAFRAAEEAWRRWSVAQGRSRIAEDDRVA